MGLDFFGVTISANIEVFPGGEKDSDLGVAAIPFSGPNGKGLKYDLWLESNSHAGVPDALKNLAYVQDITVELGLGLNSKVTLVLAPPFDDGLVLINSPLIQWGVGRLNVTFGYSTGTGATSSFTFGGVLQKPDVKIGNDIVITLEALGLGYAMKLAEGSQAENFSIDDTPASIVRSILSQYNDALSIGNIYNDFTSNDRGLDDGKSLEGGHPFFKKIFQDGPDGSEPKGLERGPRNDWWFVYDVVRSYGLELLIIDNDFRVKHAERWRGEGRVSKRFRIRAGVDPTPQEGKPIFPILSLSSPTGSVWLATGVGRQVMKDICHDGSDKVSVTVAQKIGDDADVKKELAKEGDKKLPPPKLKKLTNKQRRAAEKKEEALEVREADLNRAAKENSAWGTTNKNRFKSGPLAASSNAPGNPCTRLKDQAKGMFARHNHLKGIHVDIQTIGIPDLRPGDVVKVDGFAVAGQSEGVFDGLYGVIEVSHQVGLGGFMTTFKAISDHYPRAFQLAFQASGKNTEDDIDGKDKSGAVINPQDTLSKSSNEELDAFLEADLGADSFSDDPSLG